MKARSTARELALFGVSQLSDSADGPSHSTQLSGGARSVDRPIEERLDGLLNKALIALGADARGSLDTADGELQRSERYLLESETRTEADVEVRSHLQPAIPLMETAINRIGAPLALPIFSQPHHQKLLSRTTKTLESAADSLQQADATLANYEQKAAAIESVRSHLKTAIATAKSAHTEIDNVFDPNNLSALIEGSEIRDYAKDLMNRWIAHRDRIDQQLNNAMEKWSLPRLARVDRDILRLALLEIIYLDVPKRVAIDEAVELAKRYGDEDGYRFINGVLRRVTDKLDTASSSQKEQTIG